MDTFKNYQLVPPEGYEGSTFFSVCPQCGGGHHSDKTETPALSVSVYVSLGTWLCHHCGWRGKLGVGSNTQKSWLFKDPVLPVYSPMPLTKATQSWLHKRGITDETLNAYGVGVVHAWSPVARRVMEAIAFPFKRDDTLINLKFRFGNSGGSTFESGAEVIPFGLDDLDPEMTVFCATEVEKLTLHSLGERRVIALPNAISKKKEAQSLASIHETLAFLETHEERFAPVKKFVLCLGGGPGARAVEEELGRRLGRERCWTVAWPSDFQTLEALYASGGKERVEQLLGEAKPYPVKGVFELSDVKPKFDELYEKGLPPGPRTGWTSMDDFYRPAQGQWTLVTGIPSHGKSNWLDALMCQLAELHDWKFCLFSPENQPVARHFVNLAEKYVGVAFNPKDKSAERMSLEQKKTAEEWLSDHFSVVLPDEDNGNWTIEGILQLARSVILRKGVQGLVIDPWNEIDHSRVNGLSETEHVSRVISKIRQFARAHDVHVWLVAHPTKMYKNDDGIYPVPTPYDVAGCHDDQTDVLTSDGWVPHKDVTVNHVVACFNADGPRIQYMEPHATHVYSYSGPMHHYSGQSFDLRVTPQHRLSLHDSSPDAIQWELVQSNELNEKNAFFFPVLANDSFARGVVGPSERLTVSKNRAVEHYEGNVYCLTVPSGAYVTRRNGKMAISGNSAHFLNKADFCVSIYRFVGQADQTITDVYIQKVRFKENGGVGRVSLRYLPSVGRFVDDIDQAKRSAALNTKQTKPTEEFIVKGKKPVPEF